MQKIWLEMKYKCLTCCCLWFISLLWVPSWRVLLAGSLMHFLPLQELVLPLTLVFFLEQFRVMTFAPFWHAHIDQRVMFMACGAEPALLVYSGLSRTSCLLNECLWLHEPVTRFMSCTPLLLEQAVPFSRQLVMQSTQASVRGLESAVDTKSDHDKGACFFCRAASWPEMVRYRCVFRHLLQNTVHTCLLTFSLRPCIKRLYAAHF